MIVTEYIYTRIQVCEQQKNAYDYDVYAKYIERFHNVTTTILVLQNNDTGTWTLDLCRSAFYCYYKIV